MILLFEGQGWFSGSMLVFGGSIDYCYNWTNHQRNQVTNHQHTANFNLTLAFYTSSTKDLPGLARHEWICEEILGRCFFMARPLKKYSRGPCRFRNIYCWNNFNRNIFLLFCPGGLTLCHARCRMISPLTLGIIMTKSLPERQCRDMSSWSIEGTCRIM